MLALSLFISVVATLGRMYRDSEMTIWFASGVGLSALRAPGAAHQLAGAGGDRRLGAVRLAVAERAQPPQMKERFERRSDLSRVAPGQFQTSSDGRRVFFIERDSQDGRTGRNVFILSSSPQTRIGDLGAHRPHRAAGRGPLPRARPRAAQRAGLRDDREDAVALRVLPRAGRRTGAVRRRRTAPEGAAQPALARASRRRATRAS